MVKASCENLSDMITGLESVNRNHPAPLYLQLKSILLQSIRGRELKPKDQLPAESLLAKQFGISKATVRQALDELEREGFLCRVQGRGTFVATPRLDLGPSHVDSFTVQMLGRGLRPSSRVLEKIVIPAEGEVAERLAIPEGKRLLRLVRLRMADDEPMGLQTAHVPLEVAPGLERRDFQKQDSLYTVLREEYGLVPARAHETHSAVTLDSDQARILGSVASAPALESERVTLLASGRPMELVFSLMRGNRYRVVLELTAPLPSLSRGF
jgi:GntR family transcriptional regulator, N-acetylglucosamine utilization regulator